MTKEQYKILAFIYDEPKPVTKICEKFKLNSEDLLEIIGYKDMIDYLTFNTATYKDETNVIITNLGKEYVENDREKTRTMWEQRIWNLFNTSVAIAAFIKSFFF